MSIAPQKAIIVDTGEEVDVDKVKLNTVVAVKAGEAIPIDGIVVDGQCEVDEKSLTGESIPVAKHKDSTVLAGTINLNAEDCAVAKMTKLVEEAQNSKSSTQRFIDRCAQYYTPAIILISASFVIVPLALRVHNRDHWFHLALVVLVSACPFEPRPENVEEYENIPGEGIHGKIDGRDIYIGNKKIGTRAGSSVPVAEGRGTNGCTSIGYVYCGGNLAGTFSLSDTCRTGVKEAIAELKSTGIRTAMLTGDSQAAAIHAQQQVRTELYYS
ncbi:Cadmium/zinc-transporting ATPase HMA2 [Linum perenne]